MKRKMLVVSLIAVMLQGCAGVEFGTKVGFYRVDEHTQGDSSSVSRKNNQPMKCWFVDCPAPKTYTFNGGAEDGK